MGRLGRDAGFGTVVGAIPGAEGEDATIWGVDLGPEGREETLQPETARDRDGMAGESAERATSHSEDVDDEEGEDGITKAHPAEPGRVTWTGLERLGALAGAAATIFRIFESVLYSGYQM